MRKIHVFGLALFAVFAFGAAVVSSAFAGEWLANNNVITVELEAETEGLLFLINLTAANGTVLVELHCSGFFLGFLIGNDALIVDLDSLGGEVIGSLGDTNELALDCLVVNTAGGLGDCILNDLVLVWPLNLNLELGLDWLTTIELMGAGAEEFLLDFPTQSGYEVRCQTGILGEQENKCEGLSSAVLTNVAGGVLGEFNANSEKVACVQGGAESGVLLGEGTTKLTNGEALTVS
jgi:hypothetical protein